MLTDKRPVQWPHLTVTAIDKLLHGTFTYTNKTTKCWLSFISCMFCVKNTNRLIELQGTNSTGTSKIVVQKPHCT